MVSANLLSEWKGIEYAIEAVPKIIRKIPNFLYLVVGQTHPSYLKQQKKEFGRDNYREKLVNTVKYLKIGKHVRFVNKYVSLTKLMHYIGAADYYITPYSIDSQQATSGALAYAIGAGKLCISTPYVYAKEMLGDGRGILVPFKNSQTIADEVKSYYINPEEKLSREERVYEIGRTMTWINVAHLYFHLFKTTLNQV
jgi:glycosyltransferase involved in cell wall biosynthesis